MTISDGKIRKMPTPALVDNTARQRPVWQTLSRRFPADRDCLAAFLALESAEVLAGEKPANLVNVPNRRRPCGRNLYRLWKQHGAALLGGTGLAFRELADRGDSLLLLLYRPDGFAALLARKSVAVILEKAGYRHQAEPARVLAELQGRLATGAFPHEIGVFLGYPLKDVVGFMGWARLPFTCQGPWKIYGDPRESIRLAETHRRSRRRMARLLSSCADPANCLGSCASSVGALQEAVFSGPINENGYQYRDGGRACA